MTNLTGDRPGGKERLVQPLLGIVSAYPGVIVMDHGHRVEPSTGAQASTGGGTRRAVSVAPADAELTQATASH